ASVPAPAPIGSLSSNVVFGFGSSGAGTKTPPGWSRGRSCIRVRLWRSGGVAADRRGGLVDGRGDGALQAADGDDDAQADDGQDQRVFGRRGAGFVLEELHELRHWITPENGWAATMGPG